MEDYADFPGVPRVPLIPTTMNGTVPRACLVVTGYWGVSQYLYPERDSTPVQ